jgi:hypothetical protein
MISTAAIGDWPGAPWFRRSASGFSRARSRFPGASRFSVGDLGCTGVDVDAFKRTCRAPLNPGGWNRWLLWRTTRDEASALDVERSTYAVFGKWFELVEGPDKVSLPGNGTGKVDNLKIRIVPWDWSAPWRPVARREDCTPLPTIAGIGAIGVMVEFVFRGTSRHMPWPVHKAQIIGPWCPINADWILARAYEPPADAAPAERTAREELAEGVGKVASALLPSPVSFAIAALAVLGVWTIGHAFRR